MKLFKEQAPVGQLVSRE